MVDLKHYIKLFFNEETGKVGFNTEGSRKCI
jgi:hypothetical protein